MSLWGLVWRSVSFSYVHDLLLLVAVDAPVDGKHNAADGDKKGGSSSGASSGGSPGSPKPAKKDKKAASISGDGSSASGDAGNKDGSPKGAATAATEDQMEEEQKKQLPLGIVALQDLKSNPDLIDVSDFWTGETSKLRAKWTLKMSLPMLQLYYPRGVGLKSPPFKLKRDGPFRLELFPNGSMDCRKAGACSVRLWAPKMKNSMCLLNFYAGDLDAAVAAKGDDDLANDAAGAAASAMGGSAGKSSKSSGPLKRAVVTKEQEIRLEKEPDGNYVLLDEFCQAIELCAEPEVRGGWRWLLAVGKIFFLHFFCVFSQH